MIKLLGLLFPITLLYGEATLFLLPDDQSRFLDQLSRALKKGSDQVLVITPSFHHPQIRKALLEGIKRGNSLTLVTQEANGDPLSIVQYERTGFYTCPSRLLKGSVIVVGNRLVCTFPGSIESDEMGNAASIVRCSDDSAETAAYRSALMPVLRRSVPYLK